MTEPLNTPRSLELTNLQDNQMLQFWREYPLLNMTGIEVFENMTFDGQTAEDRYKFLRKDILRPPFDEPSIIAVMGSTGGGKGGFGMALDKLLINDLYLKEEAKKNGITIGVYTLPFSLYQQASLLERVRRNNPTFAHHEYPSPEYYHAISEMMWADIEKYIISPEDGLKKVALIESSSNTSHPVDLLQRPIGVEGVDRGNSVIYSAALDNRLRARSMIHALAADEVVQERSHNRRELMRDSSNFEALFNENITYVFTKKSGERVDVSTLPDDQKMLIMDFLMRCMAPPEVMELHKEQMISIREQLGLPGTDDMTYYRRLKKDLGYTYNDRHFATITNKHAYLEKTVDLDYFLYSLPVQRFPELLGGITL